MTSTVPDENEFATLIRRATHGDEEALADLFSRYKQQIRAMIDFRMDRKLRGRVDPSDILQDAYVDLAQRLPEFNGKGMSFSVWFRLVAKERLLKVHREHLGTQKRDARREVVSIQPTMGATSISLAEHLLGRDTSAAGNAIKAEQSARLHSVLDAMDENDREVIALRMFEGLTNAETAEILGLTKQTTSKRFYSAIEKVKQEIGDLPDFK